MTHRGFLLSAAGFIFGLSSLLSSCGLDPLAPAWDRVVVSPPDDVAAALRSACVYRAGALPAETQGKSHPNGSQIPIDHIVVLMQENRSFDHYFQKLPEYGQPDVEVAPPGYVNLDASGHAIAPFHQPESCFVDILHSWSAVHRQMGGGKMNGFVSASETYVGAPLPPGSPKDLSNASRPMGYYDETDIPFYYWLANEFALADHYHSSVPGPTLPNRMYLFAGSSYGSTRNERVQTDRTIFENLKERGVDFRIYSDLSPGVDLYAVDTTDYDDSIRPAKSLIDDLRNGMLPSVAFVDPILGHRGLQPTDEHPPGMAQSGQVYVAKVVDALTKSPLWSSTALFLVYDEHGGLFDHVPPPHACIPDLHTPVLSPGDPPGGFDRLGPRVPFIAISAFAKEHFVGHHVYDHTSVLRFIEARFVLPALTARDANAEAPWELFDFDSPPHATPPEIVIPALNPAKAAVCQAAFGY